MADSFNEALSRGTALVVEVPEWIRGPASIDGDDLVLDVARAERYETGRQGVDGLLYALAAIRQPHDALGFVRRYGMLYHGPEAQGDYRESFREWQRHASWLTTLIGMYVDLVDAVEGDVVAEERLRRHEVLRMYYSDVAPSRHELLGRVSHLVSGLVSGGLDGVEERVIAQVHFENGLPGRFAFLARPDSLIGYAYYELALQLVDRHPIGTCPECGCFFPIEHGRQRFCTPRCAARQRGRRHSRKKADPDAG